MAKHFYANHQNLNPLSMPQNLSLHYHWLPRKEPFFPTKAIRKDKISPQSIARLLHSDLPQFLGHIGQSRDFVQSPVSCRL